MALVALADYTPIAIFAPLIAACVIGASTVNPHGILETTAAYPVGVLRLIHVGALIAIAFCLCLGLAISLPGFSSNWLILRNLFGFSGLALLTATLIGGQLSWIVPMIIAMATIFAPRTNEAGIMHVPLWAWPLQPEGALGATVLAIILLLCGLGGTTLVGERLSLEILEQGA